MQFRHFIISHPRDDINTQAQTTVGDGLMPRPSPDGKWIAFIRAVEEKHQLWIMDKNGANTSMLMPFQEKVVPGYTLDFSWAPDSSHIAVVHQEDIPYWERDIKPLADSTKTTAVDADDLKMVGLKRL